jgi:HEAT repeat protein
MDWLKEPSDERPADTMKSGRSTPNLTDSNADPSKSMVRNFQLLDMLPELDPDDQLAVFERVIRSPRPQVRQRALGLGAAILSDSRLLKYLHEDDDVRRNAAVEMLKLRRRRSLELACALLADEESDVVVQAIQVLAHLRDRQAVEPLARVLEHDDPNVVQEAILALARIGDVRGLPAILPHLKGIPWVQAAALEAVGRLGSSEHVGEIEPLLADPDLEPLVIEALAKIGGITALRALARHWMEHGEQFEPAFVLRRLAEVIEGLTCTPPEIEGLEEALRRTVDDRVKEVRLAASRCLASLRGKSRSLWMF